MGAIKAIANCALIDGTGKQPVGNIKVLIEGSRIAAVGEKIEIPSGATVIDAAGKTVMPGLIDAHVHVGCIFEPGIPRVLAHMRAHFNPALIVLYAARDVRDMLEAGFTTVRDLGLGQVASNRNLESVALKKAINLGLVLGPRLVVAGKVFPTSGHPDMFLPSSWPRNPLDTADGVDEVRKLTREYIRGGVDLIKTAASGGPEEGMDASMRNYTLEELQVIVDEAHARGKKVAAHAEAGAENIKNAVRVGVDTIEHGLELDDEAIQMMIQNNTILVPTLSAYEHYTKMFSGKLSLEVGYEHTATARYRALVASRAESFKRAHRAGVKIAMGTDTFRLLKFGENAHELELMNRYGMSEMEAIVASTKTAAEAVGLESQVGTIEEGKLADIIIVDGDPLKNIKVLQNKNNILMVMKNGDAAINRERTHVHDLQTT